MNNDIVILREAIKKIVPMLAGKGLIVTQQGTQAYVKPHPVTGLPWKVNIPLLPDNAESDFVLAIQGFIDHEVSHVLYTDFLYKAREKSKRLHNLHNIFEDTMIERLMSQDFPGSKRNFSRLREYFLREVTTAAIRNARSKEEVFGYLFVVLARALAGHEEFQQYMHDGNHWQHPLVKSFMDRLPAATKAKIPLLGTTAETYDIAVEVEAILHPPAPPAPPQPPEEEQQDDEQQSGDQDEQDEDAGEDDQDHSDEEQSGDGEGQGEREHTEDSEDASGGEGESDEEEKEQDAGDGDDKGTGEGEETADDEADGDDDAAGDGSDDGDEESAGEEDTGDKGGAGNEEGDSDDADDADGSSNSSDDEKGDESEDQRAGSSADGDDEGDSSAQADDEELQSSEESESAGDEGADNNDAEDGDDADEGAGTDGGSDASGDDGDKDEADGQGVAPSVAVEHDVGDHEEDEQDEDAGEVDGLEAQGLGYDPSQNPFSELTDEDMAEKDLSTALVKIIVKEAIDACKAADYTIFTREYDVIAPLKVPDAADETDPKRRFKPQWTVELEEETRALTGVMQKDIERMMAAQSRVFNVAGQRSGRLNSSGLHRLTAGDARIFSRREEIRAKDTAVTLLSDCSGSMSGRPMATAIAASYALASVLERCNIPAECMGFTTAQSYGVNSIMTRDKLAQFNADLTSDMAASGVQYHRTLPIYMPIFKDFNERLNSEVKKRFAYQRKVQPSMGGNIDGESLEYAAMRLAKRKEKRKVIIVLSDGFPAGARNDDEHLKYMVDRLTKAGYDLVGIGIESDAVERFYDNHIVLNNVADLPKAVMGELKKILMK